MSTGDLRTGMWNGWQAVSPRDGSGDAVAGTSQGQNEHRTVSWSTRLGRSPNSTGFSAEKLIPQGTGEDRETGGPSVGFNSWVRSGKE